MGKQFAKPNPTNELVAARLDSGHIMARMAYEIELVDDALADFRVLEARIRASIRDALETYLRHEPTKVSKSRIKGLREVRRPQFRLRVGEYRVYYDVADSTVTILGIVAKASSEDWLAANSESDHD